MLYLLYVLALHDMYEYSWYLLWHEMYYEKDTGYWGREIQELEIPILSVAADSVYDLEQVSYSLCDSVFISENSIPVVAEI